MPFVIEIIRSVLIRLSRVGILWLVSNGYIQQTHADQWVSVYSLVVAAYLATEVWGLYNKFVERRKYTTSLASGPSTDAKIKAEIKAGFSAPLVVPPNEVPQITHKARLL